MRKTGQHANQYYQRNTEVSFKKTAPKIPLAGHLGINKTYEKMTSYFYWPGMKRDIIRFCKTCHTCLMIKKMNMKIPPAPLKPNPIFDKPFSKIIVDCVGPLPRTKMLIHTILCSILRFQVALPLRDVSAEKITGALINFFTQSELPKEIQMDQGSNFKSRIFRQALKNLGITSIQVSAYHPQSQGALERFHSTLKRLMKTYYLDQEKDWDKGLSFLIFAVWEARQESLGFSLFELTIEHPVKGSLKLVKEKYMQDTLNPENLTEKFLAERQIPQETRSLCNPTSNFKSF